MKSLETIRRQLSEGEFEFSRHAFRRAVERNISEIEITSYFKIKLTDHRMIAIKQKAL